MEGEEGDVFWPRALLRTFADVCVTHVVIPTIFVTRSPTYKTILERADPKDARDPLWCEVQRRNMFCCFCRTSIGGRNSVVGVRALVAKRAAAEEEENGVLFRCVFGSAHYCDTCAEVRLLRVRLDSNTAMHEVVFDRLERAAAWLAGESVFVGKYWTGAEFLRRVIAIIDRDHARVMADVGRVGNTQCMRCKRASDALKRCSICHFARYCDETCSAADWPAHKKYECPTLARCSVLYGGRRNERPL